MERLVRIITMLNASELGVRAETLILAVMPGDADAETKHRALNRDIEHLNKLGWDIRNLAPAGDEGAYRMYARDNRLRVQRHCVGSSSSLWCASTRAAQR